MDSGLVTYKKNESDDDFDNTAGEDGNWVYVYKYKVK